MTWLTTIILGIVEGITEFLPISSTGHLILSATVLQIQESDFLSSFMIAIQLGAICSVVVLYWQKIWSKPREIFIRLVLAFIPTAIIGLTLYGVVKKYLLNNQAVVLWALLIGGIILIIFELLYKEKETATAEITQVSYKNSFLIGVFQSLAIVPGVSRSAATVIGGLCLGLKRKTIIEFSFLLAVPTMLAATGLDLLKTGFTFSGTEWGMIGLGFIVSFLFAILAIKFLLNFIQKHTFIWFGVYRVVIAILFWLLIFN
jgi:undecaprenyl-diphosphatase